MRKDDERMAQSAATGAVRLIFEYRVWGAVERQKHLSVLLRVTQWPQFATGNCIRHRE